MKAVAGKIGFRHSLTRRIIGMMCMFGSVEAVTMLCGLVRNKLFAIWTGVAGVGLLGLYSAAFEMITASTQLGLRTSSVQSIASARGDEVHRTVVAVRRFGLITALFGAIATMICSPLLSYLLFGDYEHCTAFMLLSAGVFLSACASAEWAVLQGRDFLKRIAVSSMIAVPLSLLLSVPIIYYLRRQSVVPVLLVYSATLAAVMFLSRYREKGSGERVPIRDSLFRIKGFVSLGFFLIASSLVEWGASLTVMSFLNREGGAEAMGYYQSGYSVAIRYVGIVFTALGVEYFPRLASAAAGGARRTALIVSHQISLVLKLLTPCAALMAFFAAFIVQVLYSRDFMDVVPLVIFSTPGVILRGVSWSVAFVILAKGDGRLYFLTELVSSVICVLLNVAGYLMWGMAGVGISFTLWYALYLAIVWPVVRIRYGVTTRRSLSAAVAACVLFVAGMSLLSFFFF